MTRAKWMQQSADICFDGEKGWGELRRSAERRSPTVLNSARVCRNLFGPHLHFGAPVAQLDRAFGYESILQHAARVLSVG